MMKIPLSALLSFAVVISFSIPSIGQSQRFTHLTDTADLPGHAGLSRESLTAAALHPNGEVTTRTLDIPPELRALATADRAQNDPSMQQWVASQPGLKIAVREDGLYRVTRQELMNAGFNLGGDPANWRLFMNGIEQAIIVGAGDQYIEFLGRGIDTRESDTRIYYLIAGDVAGKRITSKILRPIGGNVVSNSYRVTVTKKERIAPYISSIINGEEENYWGRLILNTPPTQVHFNVTGLDGTVPRYLLTVKIQGLQGADHRIRVTLNGHEVGYITGTGPQSLTEGFLVASSVFVEGTNVLALNETLSARASLFDSVSLNYSRNYQVEDNAVSFYTPGYRRVDLTGFPTADIRLFDTTLDADPVLISNLDVVAENGAFTVRLPSSRAMVMYGMTEAAMLTSASITANAPSTLSNTNNIGEFVIITYSAVGFISASETWANYRRSPAGGGVTAKVVDVADLYDEFSYGVHTAAAISSFLKYAAANWITPPRYVLLMGDASYDPRNYEGYGYLDSVPTAVVPFVYEESGSDDALADFDGDGVPEIAIGRVPARKPLDIATVLNKTMAFETPKMQSLERGALFAYDYNYYDAALALANELPPSMPKTFVGRGLPPPNQHLPDPMAQANLINGINTGKFIVNYSGHGSFGLWASTSFFGIANVPSLTNAGRESIFTMLKCYNGLFNVLNRDSLSETLIKAPNGGAVATWAAVTETSPDYELALGARFYNRIGTGEIERMGDLVRDAKTTVAGSNEAYSWTLLGDPMLQVRSSAAR